MAVPTTESDYWSARAALVSAEHSQRYDSAKSQCLSALEQRADAVLSSVKRQERSALWATEDDLSVYPGMRFREAVHRGLRDTALWRIIRRMPKGSLLHCHMDGTVPATWLIEQALKYDAVIHIKADRLMQSDDDLYQVQVQLSAQPHEHTGNIFQAGAPAGADANAPTPTPTPTPTHTPTHTPTPTTWMSLREARKHFPLRNVYDPPPVGFVEGIDIPARRGGATAREDALVAWLHSLMTMTPAPGSKPIATTPQAWDRFMGTFAIIGGIISYEPILRAYLAEMVKVHARDNVQYIETRLNFVDEFYTAADGVSKLDHAQWVRIFEESLAQAKAELVAEAEAEAEAEAQSDSTAATAAAAATAATFLDAKIIYATVRFVTPERLQWYLDDCLALKQRFPARIVGFDLVGYEDPLVRLKTYVPALLGFVAAQARAGVHIPFLLHAGETHGDGNGTDANLYDAILLGTKRLGHALSLAKHPLLMDLCRDRGICIESCPISNEILGYVGAAAQHPLPALLNRGLPVALSNDDATQFGNFGLSYDFWQFFNFSTSATIASLYTLVRNSILHSRLEGEPADTDRQTEMGRHLQQFETQWAQWCEWVAEGGCK